LIELDGPRAEIEAQSLRVAEICQECGSMELRVARDDAERALLWKGRKEAAGALGRLTPNWFLQDAVVPRSKLPQIMREINAISARHGLLIANVFHAGDGNLHPLICYDERKPGDVEKAISANEEVLDACIALGGSVTGEHGVGLDKAKNLSRQYAASDLAAMARFRRVFDPHGIMNPDKLLPSHPACGEAKLPRGIQPLPTGTWI
jgi:glycolate oxidase